MNDKENLIKDQQIHYKKTSIFHVYDIFHTCTKSEKGDRGVGKGSGKFNHKSNFYTLAMVSFKKVLQGKKTPSFSRVKKSRWNRHPLRTTLVFETKAV